jgi:prephenate dehydrogenase
MLIYNGTAIKSIPNAEKVNIIMNNAPRRPAPHTLIIGLGLIGSSIGRALKAAHPHATVHGHDADAETLKAAASRGNIDIALSKHEVCAFFAGLVAGREGKDATRPCSAVAADSADPASQDSRELESCIIIPSEGDPASQANPAPAIDLIILAVPDHANSEWFDIIAASGYSGAITDVCSTKTGVAKLARSKLRHPEKFIPGHPMAGSEKSGPTAARADLFEDARWILTPPEDADEDAKEIVYNLISTLRARPVTVSPGEHDRIAAIISHVPHIAAAALVALAEVNTAPPPAEQSAGGATATPPAERSAGGDVAPSPAERSAGGDVAPSPSGQNPDITATILNFAAGGFKDTTRIASGNADLWAGILTDNADEIAAALSEYKQLISEFERHLREGDKDSLRALLSSAAQTRSSIS